MSKLPKNWCECNLGSVCCLDNGVKQNNLHLPLLDAKYLRGKKEPEFRDTGVVLYENDYVILVDGENSGEIFAIKSTGIMGSTFKKLNISKLINVDYILYNIRHNQSLFRTNKKGAAIPHLDKQLFKNLIINLPPIEEQGRIVEKIEELFSDIDNGIKDLKIAQAQIKQYRQSVLKSAFEGKLYKTSEWKEVKLEDVCQINPKTEIKDMKDDDIVSFLPMTSVKAECNYYTEENVLYSKVKKGYTKFKNGDVLFAKITPCMENGKVCIVDNLIQDIGFGSTEFHILRCLNNIIPKYVYYVVIQQCFRKKAKKNMVGAVGQQRVPADFMKNFDILLPPLPEQQQIVAEIEKRFAVADEMEKAVNDSLLQAEKLKQSILKQAFAGKLVPQNPNDEPAAVLLERIKTAKEKALKEKNK